jgi:hypothetical protein
VTPPPSGFVERYSSWTGRAWLEVDGPGLRVEAGPGYREARRRWREEWPHCPWAAEWGDGTFEPAPVGRPLYPVLLAALALAVAATSAAGVALGPAAAVATAGAVAWPLLRLVDHASVTASGIRLGPAWATRVAWPDVERVGLHVTAGRARLWAVTRFGGAVVDVPPALAPAVRARVRRLAGVTPEVGDGALDLRYARWRAAAAGIPAGVAAGALAAAPLAPDPFRVLFVAALVVTALGALEGAVTARATRWGAGAVAWSTLSFAVVLAALAIGTR